MNTAASRYAAALQRAGCTLDGLRQTQLNTNVYDYVTGDVTITVTADDAKIAANVTLKLADGKTALISGDAKSGYTVTTPTQVTNSYKEWLAIDTGADTTTTVGVPSTDGAAQDVDGGKRVTFTFNGKYGGADQTITVTFLAADDSTKVAQDMAATKAAISTAETKYSNANVTATNVESGVKSQLETAASKNWGSTVTATVSIKGVYTAPSDIGNRTTAEAEITIAVKSGSAEESWTYTTTLTVEKTA